MIFTTIRIQIRIITKQVLLHLIVLRILMQMSLLRIVTTMKGTKILTKRIMIILILLVSAVSIDQYVALATTTHAM